MAAWSVANVFVALLLVIATSFLLLYLWFKKKYNTYWQRKGIEGPTPSFPFGNYTDVFKNKISMGNYLTSLYSMYKSKRFVGTFMFANPLLIVTDYDIANNILAADFAHFESHGPEINEKLDPLGAHLFNASGKYWKELRNKMTPAFTTGKLKLMFLIMEQVGEELQGVFKAPADKNQEVEVLDLVARFTTDVIGNCAFGVECNSLKDDDAPFRRCGQRIFQHTGFEGLRVAMAFFFPDFCDFFGISPQKKDVLEFIQKSIRDTVEYREKNQIKRNDFLDTLLAIKNRTITDDQGNSVDQGQGLALTENEFMSQVYLFFVAGFETSSSTTSFALYELAVNQDVQEKARQHVRTVLNKHKGQYTYEALSEMEYITNVINETLRKYPPLSMIIRKCTASYKVRGTDVKIDKDQMVFVPIHGMQMDPEYFPEPEKFEPDRYTPEKRHPDLNKLHMPFGQGPRICIGQRFGIMQAKVALAKLLEKYTFSIGDKNSIPIKIKPGFNITSPLDGNWLKIGHAV